MMVALLLVSTSTAAAVTTTTTTTPARTSEVRSVPAWTTDSLGGWFFPP
jgi:hypothetical protein